MLRLTPSIKNEKVSRSQQLNVDYAGAESNVATALATLGLSVDYVSKLPANSLGDAAVASLRAYGIGTNGIQRGGDRIGTYFIELGASIRPSSVIYDRENSAIAAITENEFDWPKLLQTATWLHVSGITPAISESCVNETIKAVTIAHRLGVKVSFDLNYRRTLWRDSEEARNIFMEILKYTDLVHGNCGVLKDVFGMEYQKSSPIENTLDAALDLQSTFGIDQVALTVRTHHSASVNSVSGVFLQGSNIAKSDAYKVDILDRFGTGDAFAAGILHGINQRASAQNIVDFATASFALKHTILGDQMTASQSEIESIMAGNISGHVIR